MFLITVLILSGVCLCFASTRNLGYIGLLSLIYLYQPFPMARLLILGSLFLYIHINANK